jgi:hypothetical protein
VSTRLVYLFTVHSTVQPILPSCSVALSPALSNVQRRLVGAVVNASALRDEDKESEVTSCSAVLIKAALCDT